MAEPTQHYVKPWDHPVPPSLYKYLRPDRFDVLSNCRIKFSHRKEFADDHELQPGFEMFGTLEEVYGFIEKRASRLSPLVKILAPIIVASPERQRQLTRLTVDRMVSPDVFGILCLTENRFSERMWTEYGEDGAGFVIGFDTAHPGFTQLTTPGKLGKVYYSDEPVGTLLGTLEEEGAGYFCRKRMKYAFEKEWRSFRAFPHLKNAAPRLFVSAFDPASVTSIIVGPNCPISGELSSLISSDPRYQHVEIEMLDAVPTEP
jgi:hypothetical protein